MNTANIAIIAILAAFAAYVCLRVLLTGQHWLATLARSSRPLRVFIDHWFAIEVGTTHRTGVGSLVSAFNEKLLSFKDPLVRIVQPIGLGRGVVTLAACRNASTFLSFRRIYAFVFVREFEGGAEWVICGSEFRMWSRTDRHFSHFTYRRGHMAKGPDKHRDVAYRTDMGAYEADAALSLVTRLWHETLRRSNGGPGMGLPVAAEGKRPSTGITPRLRPFVPVGIVPPEVRAKSGIKDRRANPHG